MMSDLMREEFESAFVAEEVRRCGEGMRSSALYMVEQDTVNVRSAWWAWQASRECLVIELPVRSCIAAVSGMNYHKGWNDSLDWSRKNIEEYGIKVKP